MQSAHNAVGGATFTVKTIQPQQRQNTSTTVSHILLIQTYRHRQTDRHTDIWTDRQTDNGETDGQTDMQTDIWTDRQTDVQTDIWTDRQTDIWTYMHTYIHTDRQTDRHTHTLHACFYRLELPTERLPALDRYQTCRRLE